MQHEPRLQHGSDARGTVIAASARAGAAWGQATTSQQQARCVRTGATTAAAAAGGPDLSRLRGAHVAVLGGGVIGLATAVRLLQHGAAVTVVAHKLGGDTTTAGAAGLWGPYKLSETSEEDVNRWAGATYRHLTDLLHTADAVPAGVAQVPVHWLHTELHGPQPWMHLVDHYAPLPAHQLARYNAHGLPGTPWVEGWYHESLICEGALYLQWLQQVLEVLGGIIMVTPAPLASLSDVTDPKHQATWTLAPPLPASAPRALLPAHPAAPRPRGPPFAFDALVNCAGLGAAQLVGDGRMKPIRGQVLRVEAPWVTAAYMAPELGLYIIPNRSTVVLGGTAQEGDWSTDASEQDRARIWAGCTAMVPSLARAKVVRDWVGLRPGRSAVRVEAERAPAHGLPTVHNYGHGGAGLTLAWGCAEDSIRLLSDILSH